MGGKIKGGLVGRGDNASVYINVLLLGVCCIPTRWSSSGEWWYTLDT